MLLHLLALTFALAPYMASAAIFSEKSLVKMIDSKGFKAALKENMTSVVAFVAPWCGHCQKMVPEYSAAALGLYPLVPLYAVDCDAAANKRLCADQGVKGFPTVKLFPRGTTMKPIEFDGPQRTASAFFYWASRAIPHQIKKIHQLTDVDKWAKNNAEKTRALLLNKSNKMPLLWQSLGNKYRDDILFSSHRDRRGKSSVKMGYEAGEDRQPKVLIYPVGETTPVKFDGIMKFDSLSKFFDSVLDGTADLSVLNAQAAQEEFVPDPAELEIERQQEAEMLKLAHGGYSEMIDFEQAVKDGHGKNFHDKNGFPGMMGDAPYMKKPGGSEGAATASSLAQGEVPTGDEALDKKAPASEKKAPASGKMPATGDGGQVVLEMKTETGQPKTPTPEATPTEAAEEPEATPTEAAADPEPPVAPSSATEAPVEPTTEAPAEERVKDEL